MLRVISAWIIHFMPSYNVETLSIRIVHWAIVLVILTFLRVFFLFDVQNVIFDTRKDRLWTSSFSPIEYEKYSSNYMASRLLVDKCDECFSSVLILSCTIDWNNSVNFVVLNDFTIIFKLFKLIPSPRYIY